MELSDTDKLTHEWIGILEKGWHDEPIEVSEIQILLRKTSELLKIFSQEELVPRTVGGLIDILRDFENDINSLQNHPLHTLAIQIADIRVTLSEAYYTCNFDKTSAAINTLIDNLGNTKHMSHILQETIKDTRLNIDVIDKTTRKWSDIIHIVLSAKKVSVSEIQDLLKETYLILTTYQKDICTPKEIARLLLEIDAFLYFLSLMESNESGINFDQYQFIASVVDALKEGFFDSEYLYMFPKLQILINGEIEHVINFEMNIFSEC
ncbi:MAG: hypothetical protein IKU26_07890 [Clostridia bacterium]|nr:hypothetical protein [Clostridia bacterium]